MNSVNELLASHWGPNELAVYYSAGFTPEVVMLDGDVISHIGVCQRKIEVDRQQLTITAIGFVITDPFHRNHGFMTALMEKVLKGADERQQIAILNTGMDGLYERFGFQRVSNLNPDCMLRVPQWRKNVAVDLQGTW